MMDSTPIPFELRATINNILHGTDISKEAREQLQTVVHHIVKAMQSETDTLIGQLYKIREEMTHLNDDSLPALFDREQETRAKILDFFDCATEPDIEILPLYNFIGYHWQMQGGQTLVYSETDKTLINASDEYFDKYWSAHGYTLIRSFWQTLDGDALMFFENKLEVP